MAVRTEPAAATADRTIVSSRRFGVPRRQVFEAFRDPAQLALWWGPDGFTNAIDEFDLRPGGAWRLTMRGPDGVEYPNESVFVEVAEPERVVFRHLEPVHRFEMAMSFAERGDGTELTWRMTFDAPEELERVRSLVAEANEQNFDRLAGHLDSPADKSLTIVRTFDAPRELVFRAWTEPDRLARWRAPHGFVVTHSAGEPRVGGAWRSCMRKPDGTDLWLGGVYREIDPPRRLVLTWVWDRPHDAAGTETVVTVTLDDRCGKTRMTFRQTGFKSAESRDGHESGWTQAFERLRDLVEIADGPPAPGETTGPEGDVEFVLRRVFDAPRPLVYRAWTDPTMVVRWWGPHHFTNPVCELDVRPGGKLRIVMRGPDGRDYPFKGVFTEVVEQERLVYTNDTSGHPPEWHAAVNPNGAAATPEPDPTTTVTFEDLGDKTAVTVRMTFASPAQREGYLRVRMSDGWSQSMERLKAALSEA